MIKNGHRPILATNLAFLLALSFALNATAGSLSPCFGISNDTRLAKQQKPTEAPDEPEDENPEPDDDGDKDQPGNTVAPAKPEPSSGSEPGPSEKTESAAKPAAPVDPLTDASPTSTSLQEEKVDIIVAKALEAMGDAASLKKLERNLTIVGHLLPANQDKSSAYTYRKFRKGKKWRVDLESPSKAGQTEPPKRILAYNGLAGWRSSGTVPEDLTTVRLRQLNDDNERAHTVLARFANPDYKFTLLGATTFRQIPVFAIKIEHAEDTATTLYIDKRNFLVDGLSYETTDPNETVARKISMEYSEYRPIGGSMFPFKQTKYIDDKSASDIVVTSISTSDDIDEAVFDRPQSADKVHLSRAIVVPFDYQQREILVKGRINSGEEHTFLFDTGASDTIIDRRVAAESFLMKEGQSGMMALNGRVDVSNTVLKRLEVGNLILNDVDARIANLSGQSTQLGRRIGGIIGTNVMSKAVVRIDFGKPSLTFYDKDTYEKPKEASIVPLVQQNAPVVKAKLNGTDEVLMLADTGAAFNNIPADIAKKVLQRSGAQETHTTEGSGLDGRRIKLGNVVARAVAVGGHSVSNMNFTYSMTAPSATGKTDVSKTVEAKEGFFQNSAIGILGNPFWEHFIVTVDYKFQRLLLEPNPSFRIRNEIGKSLDLGDTKVFVYSDYRAGETAYQRGLVIAGNAKDLRNEAILYGRLASMRRMMAKDLSRPEHAKAAYELFLKAQDMARKSSSRDVEGRILADWSLLYMDNGQAAEARQTINQAIMMAPSDPQVNLDYALHLSRESNFIEMQKYLDKALFFDPSNWQALWCQFKLSEKFMDYTKGVATLKEILRYYPWSKLAASKLAEFQNMLNASKAQPKGTKPAVTPYVKPVVQ
ncbi:MAG: aspartyl protease family protein [Candidatus Obscuribacterales bacterium]|nr:aspartyl protease family protein [Candidatus Obscuribacterales bacterium]